MLVGNQSSQQSIRYGPQSAQYKALKFKYILFKTLEETINEYSIKEFDHGL